MSKARDRRAKAKARHAQQRARKADRAMRDNPDRVLTVQEWAKLNNISDDTGRRIIARGEVEVLQLSAKRIGIRLSANKAWQDARARSASAS
jgi:hypothetical protein